MNGQESNQIELVSELRADLVVLSRTEDVAIEHGAETDAINALRFLAVDAVEHAGSARVVSMPSWELFRELPVEQQHHVLPPGLPSLSIEAGATQGWQEFVDLPIGLDHFGASAPAGERYERFGLTAERVIDHARDLAWEHE